MVLTRRANLISISVVLSTFLLTPQGYAGPPSSGETGRGLSPILQYIASDWNVLTRSMTRCDSIVDPKLPEAALLYLPANFPEPDSVKQLEHTCKVRVEHLPMVIEHPGEPGVETISPQGLLFLPDSYVVPGGRFNEMYGWDSYFIILGLVRDHRIDLAHGMVENFFYEIEHYGTVLNANRTYFLTRSQPPFLTSMIMAVYEAEKAAGKDDRDLLVKGYQYASRDYEMWNRDPHLAGDTGLSRYYDFGNGPAPESLKDETNFYRKVTGYFLLHEAGRNYVSVLDGASSEPDVGKAYAVQVCDVARTMAQPDCEPTREVSLIADYYKGDRAMRESGFDISFRFGPYGAATHHYAPVCLNSLLYKTEKDLQKISEILKHKEDAQRWEQRA